MARCEKCGALAQGGESVLYHALGTCQRTEEQLRRSTLRAKNRIIAAVERAGGNVQAARRELGMDR